ncbi:MAG: CvpA family protein [Candidatus Eisenbacteria bacterium]|nr:CvpA family protein [Candidatus Eisenbacteria bacterium]
MELVLDLLLGLVVLLALVASWRNGFMRELCAVVGLIAGVFGALHFTGMLLGATPPAVQRFPFIQVVAFLLLFFVAYFLFQLVGLALSTLVEGKEPSPLSRGLALIPGALRGFGLIVVLAGGLVMIAPQGNTVLGRSKVLPILRPGAMIVAKILPVDVAGRLRKRWQALPTAGKPPVTDPGKEVEATLLLTRGVRSADGLSSFPA